MKPCRVIPVEDMNLILISPAETKQPSCEEIESETLKLITIFAGIKQRVLKENRNHYQYVSSNQ